MSDTQALLEKRTELLATLFLTRHPAVVTRVELDDIDLIVHLFPDKEDPASTVPVFGVILKGTANSIEDEGQAGRHLSHFWTKRKARRYFMPILVMLYSMNNDQGYYAWAFEPWVNLAETLPRLTKHPKLEFAKANHNASDEITEQVRAWYDALSSIIFNSPIKS